MSTNQYISFDALVSTLGLPRTYLAGLVEAQSIPFITSGGRRYFDAQAVRVRIGELAAMTMIPTKLEADVLLYARDRFEHRPELQAAFGLSSLSSPEDRNAAALRYAQAYLRDMQQQPDWPAGQRGR